MQKKKILIKFLFLIIAVPPAVVFYIVFSSMVTGIYINEIPQLSKKTVLSLYDNLSNLAITGKSNFKDDRFYLEICDEIFCANDSLRNKAIAYITGKGIFFEHIDFVTIVFYYDTIDNCNKYYEVSYNPETNTALCIYGRGSRINPFSAKIIYK